MAIRNRGANASEALVTQARGQEQNLVRRPLQFEVAVIVSLDNANLVPVDIVEANLNTVFVDEDGVAS